MAYENVSTRECTNCGIEMVVDEADVFDWCNQCLAEAQP